MKTELFICLDHHTNRGNKQQCMAEVTLRCQYYISFIEQLSKWRKKMMSKEDFLYPRGRYYGHVKPENLVFNANLQEFAQKVSYICNLETGGKITPDEAYDQIKLLWKQLKQSKKQLKIGEQPFQSNGPEDG
jgi:hypothetical protein